MEYMHRCFIIRANDALKAHIKDYEAHSADENGCPLRLVEVWQKSRSRNLTRYIVSPFRTERQVKFVFLLDLHDSYFGDSNRDKTFYHFLKELLGEPPYTEAIFDQWWTIEDAGTAQNIEEIEAIADKDDLWRLIDAE